jgi:hypothetical protein
LPCPWRLVCRCKKPAQGACSHVHRLTDRTARIGDATPKPLYMTSAHEGTVTVCPVEDRERAALADNVSGRTGQAATDRPKAMTIRRGRQRKVPVATQD